MVKLKLKGACAAVIAVLSSDEEGGNSSREISSPGVKIEYNHTSCPQEISHADLMAQLRERQQLRLQMSSEPSVVKKSWPKRRAHSSSSSNVGGSQDRSGCQYVAMKSEPGGSVGNDDVWWQCPVAACTYTILSNDTRKPQKKYNHSKSKACPIRNRSSEVKDENPVVEAADTFRRQCPLNLGCAYKVQSKCTGNRRAQNKYHDKKVCAFRNIDVVLKDEKSTRKAVESTSTQEGTKKATLRHVKTSMYSSRGNMLKSIWLWNRSRTFHLTKDELMKNSRGKIVSKKRSAHSRNVAASNFTEKIRLWSRCLETARKELGIIGMVFPRKTGGGEGQAFYERAKAIQRDAACAPKLD